MNKRLLHTDIALRRKARLRLVTRTVTHRRTLEKRAAELGNLLGQLPGVEVSVGDATAAILKAARDEESTLIAVGSRGLGATGRARLGSVSTKILRAARGPVLVYPHTAARSGFGQD